MSSIKEQKANKAEELTNKVKEVLKSYTEATPQEERICFHRQVSANLLAQEAKDAILKAKVSSSEDLKVVDKQFKTYASNFKKVSVRGMVRDLISTLDGSDAMCKQMFGCEIKDLQDLLLPSSQFCFNLCKDNKIGEVGKHCLAFAMYKWQEFSGKRMTTVVAQLSVKEIEDRAAKETTKDGEPMTAEEWKSLHYCTVLVDKTSDKLLHEFFNKANVIGIVDIENTVSMDMVKRAIRKEFGYYYEEKKQNKKGTC